MQHLKKIRQQKKQIAKSMRGQHLNVFFPKVPSNFFSQRTAAKFIYITCPSTSTFFTSHLYTYLYSIYIYIIYISISISFDFIQFHYITDLHLHQHNLLHIDDLHVCTSCTSISINFIYITYIIEMSFTQEFGHKRW